MMTATARKTSFESKHSRDCDYFAISPSCLNDTMLAKYALTGLQEKIYCCSLKLSKPQMW